LGHTISHGEAPKQTFGKLCLMSFTTQPEAPVLFSKPPAGAQVLAAACSTQMANAIILIGVTIATSVVAYLRPRSTAKPGTPSCPGGSDDPFKGFSQLFSNTCALLLESHACKKCPSNICLLRPVAVPTPLSLCFVSDTSG